MVLSLVAKIFDLFFKLFPPGAFSSVFPFASQIELIFFDLTLPSPIFFLPLSQQPVEGVQKPEQDYDRLRNDEITAKT